MVCLIDVKRKRGALVGYWVSYVTLTFDLTHDIDHWFFKVDFYCYDIEQIESIYSPVSFHICLKFLCYI